MKKVFRIQVQLTSGAWINAPGVYHTDWEAEKSARVRCTLWRIVTGSGKVVIQGPTL